MVQTLQANLNVDQEPRKINGWSISSLILGVVLLIIEFLSYYNYIYYISPSGAPALPGLSSVDGDSKGWGILFISFVMAFVSVLSLVNSFKLKRGHFKKIGTVFFVFSIVCLPIIFQIIAGQIGKIVYPPLSAAEQIRRKQQQRENEAAYSAKRRASWMAQYQELQNNFAYLKTISSVESRLGYCILDDGTKIRLYGLKYVGSKQEGLEEETSVSLLREELLSLVGKKVNIKLPDPYYNSSIYGQAYPLGSQFYIGVLIFLPDGKLLQLKYLDLLSGDPSGGYNKQKSYLKKRTDLLIKELEDYQRREPFYNNLDVP
jgi:hypothetical protein